MRTLAFVACAIVAGVALGFAVGRLTGSEQRAPDEPARVIAEGELTTLPPAPVQVRAEQVVLPAGFHSRHVHGGPTFNFVEAGAVVIESEGHRERYDAGGFFFEPARRIHTITVLDEARLGVVRLLPPGVEATTEAPE